MSFKNLALRADFCDHNFSVEGSRFFEESNPAYDVKEAFRSSGYIPRLEATLTTTLSPDCFQSFLRAHPELPISERDYYLSKLYQFLSISYLDEGDSSNLKDPGEQLEELLEEAFPASFLHWEKLTELKWCDFFRDYKNFDLEELLSRLNSYVPGITVPPATVVAHRKRGAPPKYAPKVIEQALAAQDDGRPPDEVAKLLLGQKRVTEKEKKKATSLLRYHRDKEKD